MDFQRRWGRVAGCRGWVDMESFHPRENRSFGVQSSVGNSSVVIQVPGSTGDISVFQTPAFSLDELRTPLPVGVTTTRSAPTDIGVKLETVQTGLTRSLFMSSHATLQALYETAMAQFHPRQSVNIGAALPLGIWWALVDKSIESRWQSIGIRCRKPIRIVFMDSDGRMRYHGESEGHIGDSICRLNFDDWHETLADVRMPREIIFHLYLLPKPYSGPMGGP
jgi:hypothetical protein